MEIPNSRCGLILRYAQLSNNATSGVQKANTGATTRGIQAGTQTATPVDMPTIPISTLLLLSGCSSMPPVHLPPVHLPPNAVVLRESFQEPGPDRTGNWMGWFDSDGCWWETHNTWLVVRDPVLVRSDAHPLHWNGAIPDQPWFCLAGEQQRALASAIETVGPGTEEPAYSVAMDRWTVVRGEGLESTAFRRGSRAGDWSPLLAFFEELSAMSVWGQSPEPEPV